MARLDNELLRRILDAQQGLNQPASDQSQAVEGTIRGLDLSNTILARQQAQEDRVRALSEKIKQAKLDAEKRAREQAQTERIRAFATKPTDASLRAQAFPEEEAKFLRERELERIKSAEKTKQTAASTAAPKNQDFAKARAETIVSKVDQAVKKLGPLTTGAAGQVLSKIGGTEARNLRGDLETIKANLGFQQLQEMREASKTGGALGQVAVQELEALQSAVAALDQAQNTEQLTNNLKEIKTRYQNWLAAYDASRAELDGATVRPPSGAPAQQPSEPIDAIAAILKLQRRK